MPFIPNTLMNLWIFTRKMSIKNTNIAVSSDFLSDNASLFKEIDFASCTVYIFEETDSATEKEFNELSIQKIYALSNQFQSEVIAGCRRTQRDSGNIILKSSGTTGNPKLISLPFTLFFRFKPDYPKIWASTYNLSKFAGLQVFNQAIFGGGEFVNLFGLPVKDQILLLKEKRVNIICTTPSYMRRLLLSSSFRNLRFERITLGGENANQSLLDELQSCFSDCIIGHTYASTEIGNIAYVRDGKEGIPINLILNERIKYKINEDGILFIKKTSDGVWRCTGDYFCESENRLFFQGRVGDIISVGGENVSLSVVETKLLESPSIVDIKVRSVPNSFLGNALYYEAKLHPEYLEEDFRGYVKNHMRRCEQPLKVKFVDDISLNTNGKKI